MLGYLSLDITSSSKLTVFLELRFRKTVRFSEQIMFRRQISKLIIHQIVLLTRDWPKRVTRPNIPQLKQGNIRD